MADSIREDNGVNAEDKGFLSRVFGNYRKADAKMKNSAAAKLAGRLNSKAGFLSRIRDFICRLFTESKVKNKIHSFLYKLLYLRTRDIGIYLLTAGIYTALEYTVMRFAFQRDIGMNAVYSAAALTVLSLFFFSERSLADTINKNRLLSFIIFDLFGADKSKIVCGPVKLKNSSAALLLGMATGLSAFLLNPGIIPVFILSVFLIIMIFYLPEAGAVLIAALLPFTHEKFTLALCAVTFAAFIIKVIRRKRVLRFSLIDVSVMILGVVTLLGRIASPDVASLNGSLYAVCIFAYFICRNLLCHRQWLKRAFSAVAVSCALVVCAGLVVYLFGTPKEILISSNGSIDLSAVMTAFFGTGSSLASYLLLASPFLLYFTLVGERNRLACFIAYAFSLCCIVFTHEAFAAAAAIAANFIVFILYNKKAAALIIPAVTAAAAAAIFIPPKFLSIVSNTVYAESAYNRSVWSGVFGIIKHEWLAGAGVGSFPYVYPVYAKEGFGDAADAQSMYLQIAAEGGVLLLILFIGALAVFISCCVSNLVKSADKKISCVIYTSLTAVIAVAFFGFTDSILTDNRICTLLFSVIGFGAAAAEIIASDTEYEKTVMIYTEALNG